MLFLNLGNASFSLCFSCLLQDFTWHAVDMPYVEAHTTKKWGRPPTSNQRETGFFCPTPHKNLKPTNNHINELRNSASSSQAFKWGLLTPPRSLADTFIATLWESHTQKIQLICSQNPWHHVSLLQLHSVNKGPKANDSPDLLSECQ